MVIHVCIVYGCSFSATAVLSSGSRYHRAYNAQTIYHLVLYRSWLTLMSV